MVQYFKVLVITIITALMSALPFSSAGAFNYLNNALSFTTDAQTASLYMGIIGLAFSVVTMLFVRKIYINGFKNLSRSSAISEKKKKSYKTMFIGILVSCVPALLMLIPMGNKKLLGDTFASYLVSSDMLITSVGYLFGGILALVATFLSRKRESTHKTSTLGDVIRMTVYNIIPSIFPGFSRIFMAGTSLTLSGVEDVVVMRDVLLYLAPSTFLMSLIRIIRAIVSGVVFDPVTIALCAVVAVICNLFVVKLATKINIRKNFVFYGIVSFLFGIGTIITAFVLL